ncbi:MAG: guanylate kinase [Deltaproteobacteria bacterium]|jgi:guanylate kinase|nr:guanylate kinase [Deltaproteobacteria bacterium]
MSTKRSGSADNRHTLVNARGAGFLFILSAPSGAGKTTLRLALLKQITDLQYSISYTTRQPREGEQDGSDYYFITKDEFEKGIAEDRWAEWALVHGNYYGTSAVFLDDCLGAGRDVLLDIDVQGAAKIIKRYPDSVTIFIMPPSIEVLEERLQSRATDSKEMIRLRLKNAEAEMAQKKIYRHIIINDQLSDAVSELTSLINQYKIHR